MTAPVHIEDDDPAWPGRFRDGAARARAVPGSRSTAPHRCVRRVRRALCALAAWLLLVPVVVAAGPEAELLRAVRDGDAARVERLLERGADPDTATAGTPHVGKTALMWAAGRADPAILGLLLAAGADVNATNANGGTALMYAATRGREENARRLIEAGADIDVQAKHGWNAVLLATAKRRLGVLEVLVAHGADLDARDVYGATALLRAAQAGDTRVVRFLLRSGADPRVSNDSGVTALEVARQKGHDDIVALLRAHMARTAS